MSLSRRLIRIARQTVTDLAGGLSESGDRFDARRELDEFLNGPGRRPSPPPTAPPPPPPDPLKPYYDLLGAPVGTDLAGVEKIWRRRVLATHPDRFMHDPVEQGRAAARLRRLNEAHDILVRELARREAQAG
jgi:hypothetical protein